LDERLALAENNGGASCPNTDVRLYAPVAGSTLDVSSGERIAIAGVANLPDARRYALAVRPVGGDSWFEMDTVRRATSLRPLLTRATTEYAAGEYALLLQPLSRQGNPLPGAASCTIRFALAR